ncbi:MAG: hypothetical protein IJW33_00375 [Lentisphaeria bacterium]|nr:hypothetical protein [Lentisphaeria bacterium]
MNNKNFFILTPVKLLFLHDVPKKFSRKTFLSALYYTGNEELKQCRYQFLYIRIVKGYTIPGKPGVKAANVPPSHEGLMSRPGFAGA